MEPTTSSVMPENGECPFARSFGPAAANRMNPQSDWEKLAGSAPEWNSEINPIIPGARPGQPTLLVSKHADVVEVLMDSETFRTPESINPRLPQVPEGFRELLPEGWPWEGSMLFGTEPWDRSVVRRLTGQVLNGPSLEHRLPRIQRQAEALAAGLSAREQFDVINDYSHPYILRMLTLDVLGFDEDGLEMAEIFVVESQNLFLAALGLLEISDKEMDAIAQHQADFRRYLLDLVADRAENPQEDLISDVLALQQADGEPLKHTDVIKAAQHILLGFDQPVLMIGNIVEFLLQEQQRWNDLVANPAGVPAAVEECMRLQNTLAILQTRVASKDSTVGDIHVPSGTIIALHTGAANRDPHAFVDPNSYLPGRGDANGTLTFSRGGHFCVGAKLARAETIIAVETLVKNFPSLSLVSSTNPRTHGLFTGFQTLMVAPEKG